MNSQDMDLAMQLLDQTTVQTSMTHAGTSKKEYRNMLRYLNVTSFSQLDVFHRCPRKFQKSKEEAAFQVAPVDRAAGNVDFAFGHAVGAGIQNYLITKDLQIALLNCILAWSADWDDAIPRKKKTLWGAMIAVEKFAASVMTEQLEDWELLYLPSGKPAIEVSFSFHCGNGFKHYGHMDIALRNKRNSRLMVVDCKTTGFNDAEESIYANSSQALSYAIMLETCLPDEIMQYDVMYLVYSSTERTWTPLPFAKSVLDQAEWIKDTLLTHDLIKAYSDVGFFPKRGNACYEFFRRCQYYGECGITSDERLPLLAEEDEAEPTDYVVDLQSVIDKLKERKKAK